MFDWVLNTPQLLIHCVKSVHIRSCSCPYFPAFGLNTERYFVSQSRWGKIRTRITLNTDTFTQCSHLHSVNTTFSLYSSTYENYIVIDRFDVSKQQCNVRFLWGIWPYQLHRRVNVLQNLRKTVLHWHHINNNPRNF